ncbi:MAG: hypothetical protein DWB56_17165 [Candidatus Jettenia sp.]|nr:MAG: hypothetical protein EDM77_16870 [Candidatus Jettenia sp. AMX1]MBC6930646.1 hypothetical protein [Candidatus Jettenia sp.]MCQ3919296.1 hypothetical protein [Candidatus Brocadia sp.]MDL1940677.1 hypothetical protein [Candidatus Jettenia sp. AMX1]GJQ47597.1 MAG: hypothetical protein JETCAE04_33510 [Candidatus Jettenia caeni]
MADKEHKKYIQKLYKFFMENKDDRPYWQWIAIVDPSTCTQCKVLDGKVFYYNDPIWQKHLPPIHKGCRCRFRAYDHEDIKEKRLCVSKGEHYV